MAALLGHPAFALEDCSCDGKHINLNNGSYTDNLTGIVKCVDHDSGKPTREIPYVKGLVHGWEKIFSTFSFDGATVHTEFKNGDPGCRRNFTAELVLTEEDGCEKPPVGASRVKKTFHPNGKVAVHTIFTTLPPPRDGVPAERPGAERRMQQTEFDDQGRLLEIDCEGVPELSAQRGRCTYANGKTSLTLHHKNGKPSAILPLKNGLLDGELKRFHPDGTLLATEAFKAGKRHGPFRHLTADGKPRLEIQFNSGELHGLAKCSFDGSIIFDITWQKGVPVRQRTYFLNGQPQVDLRRENNLVKISAFFDDGTISEQGSFRGSPYQPDSERDLTNMVRLATTAQTPNNLRYNHWAGLEPLWPTQLTADGVQTRYFQNGKPMQEETYALEKLQGVSKTWDDNGRLRNESTYENDVLTARKTWDEHGNLTEDNTFFPDGSRKSKTKKP
ncbi:MAG: hypothetical protein K1X64_12655 [Myxococcaceae bacterium]|nr:hypothetical protein [Myxococcaceae bacterium]